jgi:hypothetical protein
MNGKNKPVNNKVFAKKWAEVLTSTFVILLSFGA